MIIQDENDKKVDTKYQSKCNPLMPRVSTSEQGCSGKCKLLLLLNTFRCEEVLYLACNAERASKLQTYLIFSNVF